MSRDVSEALVAAVGGDVDELTGLSAVGHQDLLDGAGSIRTALVLTPEAVAKVLADLRDGRVAPDVAQVWASFMLRGYLSGATGGPIQPIEIEFENDWEDSIAAVLSRLDEVGDVIDGELATEELDELLDLMRRN